MQRAELRTTPQSRAALEDRILHAGEPGPTVALGIGVLLRTVRKGVPRFRLEGLAGLRDRSSRPPRSPRAAPPDRQKFLVVFVKDKGAPILVPVK